MIQVKVKYLSGARDLSKKKEERIDLENNTFYELLKYLEINYNINKKNDDFLIYNKKDNFSYDLNQDCKLQDDIELIIMTPIVGG